MVGKNVEKVVIMTRGLGTRMQRGIDAVNLDQRTREMAKEGVKGMILFWDRPFLDYSLEAIMHAGFTKVCLVVGPEHSGIRNYYRQLAPRLPTVEISFAEQRKPLGTADATFAAKAFVGSDSFILLNSDNLYSDRTLKMVRVVKRDICYSVGFDRDALIRKSNIEAARIKKFAVTQVDDDWNLVRIVEKPSDPEQYRVDGKILVSMNLFRFTPHIFDACSRIEPDPVRREYEIPTAVQYLVDHHIVPVKVIYSDEGVLDLTYPTDILTVRTFLRGRTLEF